MDAIQESWSVQPAGYTLNDVLVISHLSGLVDAGKYLQMLGPGGVSLCYDYNVRLLIMDVHMTRMTHPVLLMLQLSNRSDAGLMRLMVAVFSRMELHQRPTANEAH